MPKTAETQMPPAARPAAAVAPDDPLVGLVVVFALDAVGRREPPQPRDDLHFLAAAHLRDLARDRRVAHRRDAAGKLHGYTNPARGAVFVPADALETLRHETVHWVMETARGTASPAYSPWLSEGLAQLFETFDPKEGRPPRPPRIDVGDVDVDRLIRIEDYGEFLGPGALRNYDEARVLCAFLFEARGEGLREYMDAVAAPWPGD